VVLEQTNEKRLSQIIQYSADYRRYKRLSPHETEGMKDPNSYIPNLRDYFINFKESGQRIRYSDAAPAEICPYLLHSCLPYIYTFMRGGRFPWMELEENKDSVLVQCPNPKDGVVALVYKENNKIFARIDVLKSHCPFGHKKGSCIKVTPGEDLKVPLTIIDACFAWLTYLNGKKEQGSLLSPTMVAEEDGKRITFCLERVIQEKPVAKPFERPCSKLHMDKDLKLKLSSFKYRCCYFKWPKREDYNNENFGPKGMCIDLFHLAHMYAMGSIYSGDKPVTLCCNDNKACVRLSIVVKRTRTYFLRKLLVLFLRFCRINKEVPGLICELVIEEGSEACPMKLKKGMRFTYNMGRKYELCPAAFDNIYFGIHNILRGVEVTWKGLDDNKGIVVCPDIASNITFSFRDGP